ncbi:aminomethyl-transferring glycine dehydrogenase subunit GcvPB [Chlamydiota bacterium]
MTEKSIFELHSENTTPLFSREKLKGYKPANDIPEKFLRKTDLAIPEVSEIDVVRHFTRLSRMNYGVDTGFYPLGSCTMKYNPKINEQLAQLDQFAKLHPYQPEELSQGTLQILYEMQQYLSTICGMDAFCLQPAAGAHGELTGLLMVHAYHKHNGKKRTKILVPDSSHGTNPASAALAGFETITIPSDNHGEIDLNCLKDALTEEVAALMMTNPNTLGLFERNILSVAKMVHDSGALLYYDGANLNALLGAAKPGDMGFDIIHVNLHKTFSTPHGGGGPGSGPVGVTNELKEYLPVPRVSKKETSYFLDYSAQKTIGKIHSFYGNCAVILKAYCYIRALGNEGLTKTGQGAIINANYLLSKLKKYFHLPYQRSCMHEFVLSAKKQAEKNITALDIAKRLLDLGYHAPTIYFPLIVKEALMIEPTETETKDTLDAFSHILEQITKEAEENPLLLKNAPQNTPVSRLDEVKAAKEQRVTW